jgi:hypothetical protein
MSANEIRQVLGLRPSTDPKADKLINSNIRGQTPSGFSQVSGATNPATGAPKLSVAGVGSSNGSNGNGSDNGSG